MIKRTYELMFIVRSDMPDDEADKLVNGFEAMLTNAGGSLRKTERMGKRRLAYPIDGFRDGNYVLFDLEAPPEAIVELERRLRVSEPVIKFLTVRTDETDKRLNKDRKRREERLKRKPAAPAPPPPELMPASPAEESGSPAV